MEQPESSDLWTTEKAIELARLLEANPCLWDKRSDGYKKKVERYAAIKNIAKILKMTYVIVDVKIRSIVGQFQRELKKENKIGISTGKRYKSKWFLLHHLKFLLGTTRIKPTIESSTSVENVVIHVQEVEVPETNFISYDIPTQASTSTDTFSIDPAIKDEIENVLSDQWQSNESISSQCFTKNYKRKKKEENVIVNAVTSIAKTLSDNKTEPDEWDLFGNLVAKKIRSLKTRFARLQVENEINNILFRRQTEEEDRNT